ncbi:MAG: hypothetical protein DUD30_00770 [Lactobacillus sp.]|nr:MAG: hypothetical protein DUD30_00770 [Lactobacillus sp.]
MKGPIANGSDYEKQLYHIYNLFNNHFWDNRLPEVQITFTGTKGAYGHMTNEKVWVSNDSSEEKAKYELNISAYTISRSPKEICETLLHEQCHLYNSIFYDKPDCSSGGRYHNKIFKSTAESHGLTCKRTIYGWSETYFNEDGLKYFKSLNIKPFELKRIPDPKQPKTLVPLICPVCKKTKAYVTVGRGNHPNLLCSICNEPLIVNEK